MEIQHMVEIRSVSTVLPATPTTRKDNYFLSNLDMVASKIYINVVWYFPAPVPAEHQKVVSSLKESLSRTLVYYPLLAGRFRLRENGRLEVELTDEGVVFKEAYVHARFDEWSDIKDCPFELQLNPEDAMITDYSTSPLLRIQINVFSCGGIALGYSLAHGIGDGCAAFEFVKSWFEVHRNIPISTFPHFDSTIFKARYPPRVTHPNKDYFSREKLVDQIPQLPSYQTILIRLSAYQVDELVDEVETTSFEAISAFTWKVMTEARDLPDSTVTKFAYPINFRKRWDPKLPRGFFGNAAHESCLPLKAGDIKINHVSYTASIIHDDIYRNDAEYLRSVIDWMQIELEKGRDIEFNCDCYSGTDVVCTDFFNFPIYNQNFGWGKAVHFSSPTPDIFGDGHVMVLPAPDGGRSREISITMKQEHIERLLENKLFLRLRSSLKALEYSVK